MRSFDRSVRSSARVKGSVVAFALLGMAVLWRRGPDARLAAPLAAGLLAYTCAIHFPSYIDARYGLPVQPLLLMASVAGGSVALTALRSRFARAPSVDRS